MLSEDDVIAHSNDVVDIVRVVLLQILQDLKLDTGLVVEALLIPDNLECHMRIRLIIKALHSLTKATLAQEINRFKPVRYLITHDNLVIAAVIIETIVVWQKR